MFPTACGTQRDAFGKWRLPGKSSGEQDPPSKPLQMAHPAHRHVGGLLLSSCSVMSDSL